MIRMRQYEGSVEDRYWECVNKEIDLSVQQEILRSSKNFMPPDFFSDNPDFRELVLAPYAKLKKAYTYIEKNIDNMRAECFVRNSRKKWARKPLYAVLYDSYNKISQNTDGGVKMNVFLVQNTGLTVCPYCNRDYINSRSGELAGAQLDHFYPRSKYPVFSVCLYNLIPSCWNCNRIKQDKVQEFASPFDEEVDWENSVRFTYVPLDVERKKIVIDSIQPVRNNIKTMQIETAYQIHEMEVNELLDKVQMYQETQLEEFNKVLGEVGLTEQDMKTMVFGPEITEENMRKKPLGKMLRDLERELGIY